MKQLFSKFLVAFFITSAVVLSWSEYFLSDIFIFCVSEFMKRDVNLIIMDKERHLIRFFVVNTPNILVIPFISSTTMKVV